VSKRAFFGVLKYLLGFGLLAWVVWVNWKPADGSQGLQDALAKDIAWTPLLLAGLICVASTLLTFVRWYVLVRAQELPFTLSGAMRLGLIGYYLNTFLPGSIGGDIVKAACIARQQSRRTVAVATVLIDRALGLCGLFWLVAVLGSVFWITDALPGLVASGASGAVTALELITLIAVGLTVASVLFWLLLGVLPAGRAEQLAGWMSRFPKLGPSLAEFWRAVWMYRCRGRSIALALAMAVVGHVGFVLTFYFAALTLTAAADLPTLGAHFLLVPVGMAFMAFFPTPGGVGGGEAGFGAIYRVAGFAAAPGVLATLVQRAITWVLGLAGYLVYLQTRPGLPAPEGAETPEQAEPDEAPFGRQPTASAAEGSASRSS
jgi:uncharacterized protein (TIRG00374 family)